MKPLPLPLSSPSPIPNNTIFPNLPILFFSQTLQKILLQTPTHSFTHSLNHISIPLLKSQKNHHCCHQDCHCEFCMQHTDFPCSTCLLLTFTTNIHIFITTMTRKSIMMRKSIMVRKSSMTRKSATMDRNKKKHKQKKQKKARIKFFGISGMMLWMYWMNSFKLVIQKYLEILFILNSLVLYSRKEW